MLWRILLLTIFSIHKAKIISTIILDSIEAAVAFIPIPLNTYEIFETNNDRTNTQGIRDGISTQLRILFSGLISLILITFLISLIALTVNKNQVLTSFILGISLNFLFTFIIYYYHEYQF